MGAQYEAGARSGWPLTVPVAQASVIERIGWDALLMVNGGRFSIERNDAGEVVGIRIDLEDYWWLVVVGTADGYSVGRFRAMVAFGWVHGLGEHELTEAVQRAAAIPYAWPPTEEEPW